MEQSIVLKFGGASVQTTKHFSLIAQQVIAAKKHFSEVIIVVSAMGNTTNDLDQLAHSLHPNPPRREYDMLVSAGERMSIALLAIALDAVGQKAVSFTGSQSGIITSNEHGEAKIIDVRPKRIREALKQGAVAIVAGFQGVSLSGEITTLGRGGSDTTAVALGVAFNAPVRFFKDVQGIYTDDPKKVPAASIYSQISYAKLLEDFEKCQCSALGRRSIALAEKNQVPLYVQCYELPFGSIGTVVKDESGVVPCHPAWEAVVEE